MWIPHGRGTLMSTPYHARYFAHELTRRGPSDGMERLSMSLFDACVDLNPHQIEAALFALRSPLSKGVILADEVGLGKTIEAGLVLCQYWAERRRRLLVICPASIRKQWSLELTEKFNLPNTILDGKFYRQAQREGNVRPFMASAVLITSMNFACQMKEELRAIPWDLAIIDEAHKLRNAYRPSNKMGQAIKWALEDRKKILVTATPLQNSLLELYGLTSVIDDHIFGEVAAFRTQYMSKEGDLSGLQKRLGPLCQRTLRKQVVEYIRYTERRAITRPFRPTDEEHKLYEAISDFLLREDTYSIPNRQRQLTTLILRKLLASSSRAVAGTLETMKARLENLKEGQPQPAGLLEQIIEGEEIEDEYLDEPTECETGNALLPAPEEEEPVIDRQRLTGEIEELDRYAKWARSIGIDTKTRTLLSALEIGFSEMEKTGAARKALIFTESRRTQEYLKAFLEANGYAGEIVIFNGTNSGPEATKIYNQWSAANESSGRTTGSRPVDIRTALIEHFRDHASIMIATEAAAEGVNLQFCSLVINYDLPWNPQRIEQRIGRCHRYNQEHDVVVINFLNERNQADQRVLELLSEKFNLFSGIFGASDEVLGAIESGVDFEKRILAIYQQCRTPEAIEAAFKQLREEMDDTIKSKLDDTRRILIEHFDEDVHARLRVQLDAAKERLDRFGRMFWTLTKFVLKDRAEFSERDLTFDLMKPPFDHIKRGRYHLISKAQSNVIGEFLYRLSHPLGEHVIESGKQWPTPVNQVSFDITAHPGKISVIENLKGISGWLVLQRLAVDSFEHEEYLLFSGFDDKGRTLDQEACIKLFNCEGSVEPIAELPTEADQRLKKEAERHAAAMISRSLELNNRHFREERERLEGWADDMVLAAERELADTKAQLKLLSRQARCAETLEQQHAIQLQIKEMERKQRKQRQQIFDVEDAIIEKRDKLVAGLEKRMSQRTSVEPLFVVRWKVV